MPEKHDHDKHFIGTVPIEPVAMSFILRVYEVLASHNVTMGLSFGILERFSSRLSKGTRIAFGNFTSDCDHACGLRVSTKMNSSPASIRFRTSSTVILRLS